MMQVLTVLHENFSYDNESNLTIVSTNMSVDSRPIVDPLSVNCIYNCLYSCNNCQPRRHIGHVSADMFLIASLHVGCLLVAYQTVADVLVGFDSL